MAVDMLLAVADSVMVSTQLGANHWFWMSKKPLTLKSAIASGILIPFHLMRPGMLSPTEAHFTN